MSERGPELENAPWDTARLAALLDRSSREGSKYAMARMARDALGVSLSDGSDALPWPERATLWALEYHVETVDKQGRRRVRLAPAHETNDGADPPAAADAPQAAADVWADLLHRVAEPPAVARLHHLLFERSGPGAREHARAAAAAYLASARDWSRGADRVQDLAAATRLARAVDDQELVAASLDGAVAVVQQQLDGGDPLAGVVLRALEHLVGEPGCPAGVDDLLERASTAWPDADRRDRTLTLMLARTDDDAARREVWQRRVAAYMDEAHGASSGVMRSVRLQKALALAERSGDKELRQTAAAALQKVRTEDLELMSFTATSRLYEEEFERQVQSVTAGASWRQALITFATLPPLSGDTDRNRDLTRQRQAEHPLSALFPTQLLGPEGLPAYTGTSPEDRFDVELVRWESELISFWFRILAAGLHDIPRRHGLPELAELGDFLSAWPAGERSVSGSLARALLRYWTGDSEGAAYTVLPRIEAVARRLVVSTERGVYRLQREHRPGQYAGLGQLLPILAEEYELPEPQLRFLSALLRHPAGLNLRNLMLHGFVGDPGPEVAATLLHAALALCMVEAPTPGAQPDGDPPGPPPPAEEPSRSVQQEPT